MSSGPSGCALAAPARVLARRPRPRACADRRRRPSPRRREVVAVADASSALASACASGAGRRRGRRGRGGRSRPRPARGPADARRPRRRADHAHASRTARSRAWPPTPTSTCSSPFPPRELAARVDAQARRAWARDEALRRGGVRPRGGGSLQPRQGRVHRHDLARAAHAAGRDPDLGPAPASPRSSTRRRSRARWA